MARPAQHLALIDGGEITRRRTAAASALAGSFLAREDAASLLIVGSGHVGGLMAEAYRVVRPIERVMVWNIRRAGAERLAARIGGEAVTRSRRRGRGRPISFHVQLCRASRWCVANGCGRARIST